jgi:indolepyruvate ferredoxin oxidoreductase
VSPRELEERLRAASIPGGYISVDAAKHAKLLAGLEAGANLFIVGVAVQRGAVPVSPLRLREAIELNGVAVSANLAAFEWGRRWADSPAKVDSVMTGPSSEATQVTTRPLPASLARRVEDLTAGPAGPDPGKADGLADLRDLVTMLASDLVSYQDVAYAHRFVDLVAAVAAAEQRAIGRVGEFTDAVARGYHKLLAYKDEYEVARLMVSEDGLAAVGAAGGSADRVTWHLHPPALRAAGMRKKIGFGPWSRPLFVALARSKRLRGTRLDPFGRTDIRRLERQLPVEYAAVIGAVTGRLNAANMDDAVALASLPDMVRGFESLKARRAVEYRARLADRLAAFGDVPAVMTS